ncbi:MRG-domain-containing protein [Fennellomyces sp. T-0311]|nr:MRG-domain-containing protein [Fennellomyces sp. T-0311]
MTEENAHEKKYQFDIDEKSLCFHGPLIYEAKILDRQWMDSNPDFQGPYYFVHYKGWKRTWDEWVPETRVLRWNDSNLQMQQKLKELYTQQQHSGKKRPRDSTTDKDEDYLNRPEVRVDIPDTMKAQLVDDWENVTKNQQLVELPRSPTISELLEQYRKYRLEKKGASGTEDLLSEIIDGVKEYFNKALGTMLLYRFERHQYASLRKRLPKTEMVDIYGAEHLLRLFVQMPSLIAHTDMDADATAVLTEYLNDIIKYMHKNQRQFFCSEYENATPDYVSLTSSI